jgi:hypothetical protein
VYEEEKTTGFANALQGFMTSFFTGQDRAGRYRACNGSRAGQDEKIFPVTASDMRILQRKMNVVGRKCVTLHLLLIDQL